MEMAQTKTCGIGERMMSDIKRYSPIGGAVTLEFDGHYVKYSDHEKQLSTMREALRIMEAGNSNWTMSLSDEDEEKVRQALEIE